MSSPAWHKAVNREGLVVFYADARQGSNGAYVLHNEAGAVLGTLFARVPSASSVSRETVLGPGESKLILATRGRRLTERWWGSYAAFLHDAATDTKWIMRDPSGCLPCFSTNFRGVNLYFSRIEDCVHLELLRFTINWNYVAARVAQALTIQSSETGLNEVCDVQPGECIEWREDHATRSFYWHPLRIAESGVLEDPKQALVELRQTTKMCVQAWASCYSGILHRLSGGLDSSVVLGCMRDAPSRPKVTCLHYYSPGSTTDERAFARASAQHARCLLIERERNKQIKLREILDIARFPHPSFYIAYLQNSRMEADAAAEFGASAIFTGLGGDQVFVHSHAGLPAADFAYRHGFRRKLLRIALDIARQEQTSVRHVLRHVLRYGVLKRKFDPYENIYQHRELVNPETIRTASRSPIRVHPWFRSAPKAAPGKYDHAFGMSWPVPFYDPVGRADDPESVSPLLSQPLVEVALRIPTYVLASGVKDRTLARAAFADDVPREILTRTWKGTADDYLMQVLHSHIDFIREIMLDGILIRERLLDRPKVEEILSGRVTRLGNIPEIFDHLGTEAWLRGWPEARHRSMAA